MKPTPESVETLAEHGYRVERVSVNGRGWRVVGSDNRFAHSTPFVSVEWINNLAKEISNEKTMD